MDSGPLYRVYSRLSHKFHPRIFEHEEKKMAKVEIINGGIVNGLKYKDITPGQFLMDEVGSIYAVVYNSCSPAYPIVASLSNPTSTRTRDLPSYQMRIMQKDESFKVTV
jgi:hypothetical protein